MDPAQLEQDRAPRGSFSPSHNSRAPHSHAYHDHGNHDGSNTDQVQLPGEELVDFFVAVRGLKQRSMPVREPAFPSPAPAPRKVGLIPLVPLAVLDPGSRTSHQTSPLWTCQPPQAGTAKEEPMGTSDIPLHHTQINEISTLYLIPNKSPNYPGS